MIKICLWMSCLLWLTALPLAGMAADDRADARRTLRHDGVERSYLLRVPESVSAGKIPLALVLVLHGGGGNADNAERMSGFTKLAMKEGFIVAYPEGSSRFAGKLLTWNAGHCCGYAMERKVDDVGFIAALIDQLSADYPIDPRRIYVTGMSNGGMMTHRLGMQLSDKLAAIAPIVAALFGDEPHPAHPVSALMFNGMLDKSVPYLGGAPGGRFVGAWGAKTMLPAMAQGTFWAAADGCAADAELRDSASYVLRQYRCPDNREVALYLVKDNGHAWPGGERGSWRGDNPSTTVNATEIIWQFFKTHPK